jgi:hypothetical protein
MPYLLRWIGSFALVAAVPAGLGVVGSLSVDALMFADAALLGGAVLAIHRTRGRNRLE